MGYSTGRRGADSRCCRPVDPPWEWHDYVDPSDVAVLELEAWLDALTPWARDHELGKIDDLLDAAALGDLEDSGDERTPIVPVRTDPEIYELRHRALAKQLRFYHGEPSELPMALVALQRHIKSGREHQQQQIDRATQRYINGRADLWELG